MPKVTDLLATSLVVVAALVAAAVVPLIAAVAAVPSVRTTPIVEQGSRTKAELVLALVLALVKVTGAVVAVVVVVALSEEAVEAAEGEAAPLQGQGQQITRAAVPEASKKEKEMMVMVLMIKQLQSHRKLFVSLMTHCI